jgi:hypothetical protein
MSEIKQVGAPETATETDEEGNETADAREGLGRERSDRPRPDVEGAEKPPREAIRLDVIFDILKNQRRRHVLRYLRENQTTTLSDLAEHVAALENDKSVHSLTSSERKRVYVGLYQCHLPRMNDAGVIEFDSDRGRIELNETAEYLEPYLEAGAGTGRPWPLYHVAIALGGGLAYGLSAVAFGLQAMPTLVIPPLLILAVMTSSLIEYRERSTADEDRR